MSSTTIYDLNDHCLMKIFSFLTIEDRLKTEEVCQRWLNVGLQGWPDVKDLEIGGRGSFKSKNRETILHRCGRFLETFFIFIDDRKQIDLLQMTVDSCPQLRTFQLHLTVLPTRAESSNFHLRNVFSKLPELHTVRLNGCLGDILDDHLSTLSVQNLKDLTIGSYCMALPTSICTISANISRFSNLQRLSINWMTITDDFVRDFEKLEHLTSLCLSDMYNIPVQLSPKIASLKNLTSLTLGGWIAEWWDHHISAVTKSCLKLTYLSLLGMPHLTESCFHDIAQLPSLQTLEVQILKGITSSCLNGMHQIRALKLVGCPRITSQGLKQLIKSSTKLRLLTIGTNENQETIIKNVNDAILCRESRSQFTLDIFSCSPSQRSLPENLSPLLTLARGMRNDVTL